MHVKTNDIWVFIEQNDGKTADVSLELLTKGRKLQKSLGGGLKAVLLGSDVHKLADEIFSFGADEIFISDHPELQVFRSNPYSRIINRLVSEHQPRIFLFGATITGRDIAPRIASYTRCGLTADCTELKIEDVQYLKKDYPQLLLQIRPAFGGNIIATIITPEAPIQMATVREGVMQMSPASDPAAGKITEVPYEHHDMDDLVKIIERCQEETRSSLKSAPIIVAGGYGVGSKGNFALLETLAETIGGETAGSRAAVDAGFVSPRRQIGQTGITVRPKLYIACGISGAIQHRAGMEESQKIIAVNTDPTAPIFDICHYGIVGDLREVIPMFIDAFRNTLK